MLTCLQSDIRIPPIFRLKRPPRELLAVVIETNPPPNLFPIALHFATVLGPAWKIVIYTLEENWVVPNSRPFLRALESNTVEIRFLPPGTILSDGNYVSDFMGKPWFWEQLQDAAHVLLFQLDSMICTNSERRVEDFLQYDFIGAPIDPEFGHGYNGGLSLRNPRVFLNLTREGPVDYPNYMEDQWFYKVLEGKVKDGIRLASPEVAETFAVETRFYDRPLGYHQPERYQAEHMDAILQWCPEVAMAGQKRTPW